MSEKHASRPTKVDNPPPYRSAGTKKSKGPLKSAFRRVKAIFKRSKPKPDSEHDEQGTAATISRLKAAATISRLKAELKREEIAKESHKALLTIHYAHLEAQEAEKESVQDLLKSRAAQGTLTAAKENAYNARIRHVEAWIKYEKIKKIEHQTNYEAADAAVQRLMLALQNV